MEPFAITPPGGPEWIIILVVVILLFGARKLPELGSSVGKSIKNFKKGIEEGQDDTAGADGDRGASADADAAGTDGGAEATGDRADRRDRSRTDDS